MVSCGICFHIGHANTANLRVRENGPWDHTMVNPPKGTPAMSNAGSWGAVDVASGQIVWQVADPNGTIDLGPVSVANGVVFVSSMGAIFGAPTTGKPQMFALDSGNGKQLWSYDSGGSVNAGPAIVDGTAYWGCGYSNLGLGRPCAKLYAFKPTAGS